MNKICNSISCLVFEKYCTRISLQDPSPLSAYLREVLSEKSFLLEHSTRISQEKQIFKHASLRERAKFSRFSAHVQDAWVEFSRL